MKRTVMLAEKLRPSKNAVLAQHQWLGVGQSVNVFVYPVHLSGSRVHTYKDGPGISITIEYLTIDIYFAISKKAASFGRRLFLLSTSFSRNVAGDNC